MSRHVRALRHAAPLACLDMVFAIVCAYVAFMIRFYPDQIFDFSEATSLPMFGLYLRMMCAAPIVRLASYMLLGVYRNDKGRFRHAEAVFALIKAVSLGSVILMVMAFLGLLQWGAMLEQRVESHSRLVFVLDWWLNLAMVLTVHTLWGILRDEWRRRGATARRVVVQGTGTWARTLIEEFEANPELGYSTAGFIEDRDGKKSIKVGGRRIPKLGGTGDILGLVNRVPFDDLIITEPTELRSELVDFVEVCHELDIVVRLVPDLYGILYQAQHIEELGGMPVIQVNEISIVGMARFLKHCEDFIVAVGALLVLSPLLLLTALAIKLESPGPVLFRQKRTGKNGRHFWMYKFRSMHQDAEARRAALAAANESDGPLFKMKNDPRVTRVGRIIRKLSIDELPQLINVLKGEMSLIGPRPLPAVDVARPGQWEGARFSATPGITGLWQVNRVTHSSEEMLRWDLYYIENWSLWLDFQIFLKTIGVVLMGKGAY
jgi:exopolysaccharide biosynthesis polyprenyl glycosylphosphotransferase